MVDVVQAIVDIIDGVLLGIPSNILMGDISHKYNIEIADLQRTYDLLSQEYNNDLDLRNALENKQYEILNSLSTTSPLGAWRNELQHRYNDLGQKKEQLSSRLKQTNQKMVETSTALTKKQLEAGSSTLGSEASKLVSGGNE